jgi:hypothetical protein
MDAALQTQLTLAAFVCSVAALFFSLLAAFPGLKVVFAAVRDGVLWCALFLILGGIAFLGWQQVQRNPSLVGSPGGAKASTAASQSPQQAH